MIGSHTMSADSRLLRLTAAAAAGVGVVIVAFVLIERLDADPVALTAEHAASPSPAEEEIPAGRSLDVPDLPFADNPDPSQCGIPVQWTGQETAWLSGVYEGELIQNEVLLYDSHLRLDIAASGPHGAEVTVLMYQPNPVLDYYLVDLPDQVPGWIPAPFLSFEPIEDA